MMIVFWYFLIQWQVAGKDKLYILRLIISKWLYMFWISYFRQKSLFSCFSICIVYWPFEFRHNNLQHILESHLKAINQQIFLLFADFPPMEPQGVGIEPLFFAKRYNPSERGVKSDKSNTGTWYLSGHKSSCQWC